VLIIRGIIALVAGVFAFFWPGVTIAALVVLFGAYAIVDGVTNLVLGFSREGREGRWAHVFQGIAGIVVGVLTFTWPVITGLSLVWLIAAWAMVTGILAIVAAVRLRRVISGEWLLGLSGVLSILFGLFVFARPLAGAVAIAWTLGVYVIAIGITLIALGIRLRSRVLAA
jgi:uncharacterized membrane protein HdeD (DUF308 family)